MCSNCLMWNIVKNNILFIISDDVVSLRNWNSFTMQKNVSAMIQSSYLKYLVTQALSVAKQLLRDILVYLWHHNFGR